MCPKASRLTVIFLEKKMNFFFGAEWKYFFIPLFKIFKKKTAHPSKKLPNPNDSKNSI